MDGDTTILPLVTFLISTYNRRDVLLRTLGELAALDCEAMSETIVVDNASSDGTANAISLHYPNVQLIRGESNRGACAKNDGLLVARGQYVVFLDDDSYPDAASIDRMVQHFEAERGLAATVFEVVLPDGSRECSAYPSVFIGCGTGFRREALLDVGGLPEDFFMQAEEYDLSLRLLNAGWSIRRFDDLRVSHLKTSSARMPTRTMRLDVRNNLTLILRDFPRGWRWIFAVDWMRRYRWIAQTKGWRHRVAFWRGLIEGVLRPKHRQEISADAFEQFAMVQAIQQRFTAAVSSHQSILLIDVGKNILPFWLAAKACGVRVVAVADARLAKPGRKYHGVPVVDDAMARLMHFDAAVIANVSPVHAAMRRDAWRQMIQRPVLDLFEPSKALSQVA